MAKETHVPPQREGAMLVAPTAPHATPPERPYRGERRRATGPERFWSSKRVRAMLVVTLAMSAGVHFALSPWSLLPEHGLETREVDAELTIPVDLLTGENPTTATPPEEPAEAPKANAEGAGPGLRDAGAIRDAGARDGESDAAVDGGRDAGRRDAGPRDAGRDAEEDHDGAVPLADKGTAGDAGMGGSGPRDPGALLGAAAEGVTAAPTLVQVVMNMNVVRTHPLGAKLGPLLAGIPQWDDFMSGTDVDPVKDIDWIMIFGPSLLHTESDVVLVRYNMTEQRAQRNVEAMSRKDVGGGAVDLGVAGVRAWRGHADRADRVFLLIPRSHVVAMTPPKFAPTAARVFVRSPPSARLVPGEAVRVMVKHPHGPFPFIPESLGEARIMVLPRTDGGADVNLELDATDEDAAQSGAETLRRVVRGQNSILVRIATRGLLNGLDFDADGKTVKGHVTANSEQLQAIYDFVAAQLGIAAPAPGTPEPLRAPPRSAPR